MLTLVLLKLLSLGCVASALNFTNGPGLKLKNGGHTSNYEPILELSEVLIASELGENSTALQPYAYSGSNETSSNNVTATSQIKNVFKRQDNRPDGALKCSATEECIDGSCCGAGGTCGYKDIHCGAGCQSHCRAKAMCGIDSQDSAQSCGLQLCCSYYGWCGTKDIHCIDPEPLIGKTPCQVGYGGCELKPSPECNADEAPDTGFRRIAYYAGWNSRDRKCDRVWPKNINTTGLTHLMYSFVGFDPETFTIDPDPKDIDLFRQFTSLGSSKLKTWIAVGGWKFNDPGDTTTAYSNMVSTADNRAAFIDSLIKFMDTYGFTGADIDWEYPSNPERGGRKEDKDNLVLLMKEMKAKFGRIYGVSVVLAPDYWYLQGFAPAAMEEYVDHLGFMAYDLHGSWDSENALGSLMRPHTDIRDIDNGLTPLWFDGVNPKKVVVGIAYYGRSFTAKSTDCPVMGCEFSGPGKPYGCTNNEGILSNMEIRRIIDDGATPYLLEGAMVKELIYNDDQWVSFDDWETIALKEKFARKRCLGGTMIWSIDYDSPTSEKNPYFPDTGGDGNNGGGSCGSCDSKFEPSKWDPIDPEDFSSIKKLAAIGDSYSAGIGAGNRLGSIFDAFTPGNDWSCSRYDLSYPKIISKDSRLANPAFQFESCSGAVAKEVVEKQITQLDNNQDAILLSIGGNDVDLVKLLNQCIYQIVVLNAEQVAIAKLAAELDEQYAWAKDFDFESLGRGCEGQIDRTRALASSSGFRNSLDQVLAAAKKKLAPGGRIYWTGYGKFFSEDMTTECDKVTWTTWLYRLANVGADVSYLTRSRRTSMNVLVDLVNGEIIDAIARAGGDNIRFINWDLMLGLRRARYCESGIDESTKESNSRPGLMFYELNSWDLLGNSPWKRGTGAELQGTFLGDMSILAQIQLLVDPNAKLTHEHQQTSSSQAKGGSDEVGTAVIDLPIPDGYGRVFHPQISGHLLIADLVIYTMALDRAIDNGYEKYEFDDSVCPINQPPTTDPGPKNALNIILEIRNYQRPDINWQDNHKKWLLYSVPYGTGSECTQPWAAEASADPPNIGLTDFPAGTYAVKTQDGDCEYKNDGNDNAGTLWCGETSHGCRQHEHKSQRPGQDMSCDLPLGDHELWVHHRAVVVCEW